MAEVHVDDLGLLSVSSKKTKGGSSDEFAIYELKEAVDAYEKTDDYKRRLQGKYGGLSWLPDTIFVKLSVLSGVQLVDVLRYGVEKHKKQEESRHHNKKSKS